MTWLHVNLYLTLWRSYFIVLWSCYFCLVVVIQLMLFSILKVMPLFCMKIYWNCFAGDTIIYHSYAMLYVLAFSDSMMKWIELFAYSCLVLLLTSEAHGLISCLSILAKHPALEIVMSWIYCHLIGCLRWGYHQHCGHVLRCNTQCCHSGWIHWLPTLKDSCQFTSNLLSTSRHLRSYLQAFNLKRTAITLWWMMDFHVSYINQWFYVL